MMPIVATVLLLAASTERLWYAVPLVVSVSLVYAATRHEEVGPILRHALHVGARIVLFMLAAAIIVQLVTWSL